MNALAVISPGLKVLFECVGKPTVINPPEFLHFGGTGAVIACNHVGWADSLWVAYSVYPRQLRYMSKQELFGSILSRWVLERGGSIPIDRADPSPSSIKAAIDILQRGEIILIFPSGTRSDQNIQFKRGAATIALHARVPLVPAYFQGPKQIQVAHLIHRPSIEVRFGSPIPTAELPLGKETTINLTRQLQVAISALQSAATSDLIATESFGGSVGRSAPVGQADIDRPGHQPRFMSAQRNPIHQRVKSIFHQFRSRGMPRPVASLHGAHSSLRSAPIPTTSDSENGDKKGIVSCAPRIMPMYGRPCDPAGSDI